MLAGIAVIWRFVRDWRTNFLDGSLQRCWPEASVPSHLSLFSCLSVLTTWRQISPRADNSTKTGGRCSDFIIQLPKSYPMTCTSVYYLGAWGIRLLILKRVWKNLWIYFKTPRCIHTQTSSYQVLSTVLFNFCFLHSICWYYSCGNYWLSPVM